MSRIETIREDLAEGRILKFISRAYTEVSTSKMNEIRSTFETNRLFYEEIRKLYTSLKRVALKRGLPNLVDRVTRADRLLAVAVTSNHRFVGELNWNVINQFLQDEEKYTHQLVVGRIGIRYLQTLGITMPVDTMEFEHDRPSSADIRRLMDYASDYDRVYVYHPQFRSIRTQHVGVRDITYSPDTEVEELKFDYILEPELPMMLSFFETQVRHILFERSMLETELAWTAARLWEMSAAEERADTFVQKKNNELLRSLRSLRDIRLLESVTGILYEQGQ